MLYVWCICGDVCGDACVCVPCVCAMFWISCGGVSVCTVCGCMRGDNVCGGDVSGGDVVTCVW
jgi:hypothetical protein